MAYSEFDESTYAGSGTTIKCAQGPLLTPSSGAVTVTDSFHEVNGGTIDTIYGGVANSIYVLKAAPIFGFAGGGNVNTNRLTVATGDVAVFWFDGSTFEDFANPSDLFADSITVTTIMAGSLATSGNITAGGNVAVTGNLSANGLTGNTIALPNTTATVGEITRAGSLWAHNYAPSGQTGRNTFLGTNAGNRTASRTLTITGATNANPIVITTSAPHAIFAGGPSVTVASVGGNTAANGSWAPTIVSPTTFSIPTAGNGVYTSGGTVSFPVYASDNTGLGALTLGAVTSGSDNTAAGMNSLASLTSGYVNTGVGVSSLASLTTGYENVAVGNESLSRVTTGHSNTAVGVTTAQMLTTGLYNTAVGVDAMNGYPNILTGSSNTAVGGSALASIQGASSNNTGVGAGALQYISTGTDNVAIGLNAGGAVSTGTTDGSSNTFIGSGAGPSAHDIHTSVAIGKNAIVASNNSIVLGGTGADGVLVGIGTTTPTSKLHVVGLSPFANNAAAITGGLSVGAFYYETGTNPARVAVVT